MSELIDETEKILQIWVQIRALWRQITQLLFNHQSVDTIKHRQHFMKDRRTPMCQLSYDKGGKSMKDLIDFLYNIHELNIKYHFLDDNCKDFAKKIFDEFAETKVHDTVFGA